MAITSPSLTSKQQEMINLYMIQNPDGHIDPLTDFNIYTYYPTDGIFPLTEFTYQDIVILDLNGNPIDSGVPINKIPVDYVLSAVPYCRNINTIDSVIGGGNLKTDLTLSLVGDVDLPGSLYYYGTDNNGTKGFYSLSGFCGGCGGSVSAGGPQFSIQFNNNGLLSGTPSLLYSPISTSDYANLITYGTSGGNSNKTVIAGNNANGGIEIRSGDLESNGAYFQANASANPSAPGHIELFFNRNIDYDTQSSGTFAPYGGFDASFGGYNTKSFWTLWSRIRSNNNIYMNCDYSPGEFAGAGWGQFGFGRNHHISLPDNIAITHELDFSGTSRDIKSMNISPIMYSSKNTNRYIGLDISPRWVDQNGYCGSVSGGVNYYGLLVRQGKTGLNISDPIEALEVGGNILARNHDNINLISNGTFSSGTSTGWNLNGFTLHTSAIFILSGGSFSADPFNSVYSSGTNLCTLSSTGTYGYTTPGNTYVLSYRIGPQPIDILDFPITKFPYDSTNGFSGISAIAGGVLLPIHDREGFYNDRFVSTSANTNVIFTTYNKVSLTDITLYQVTGGDIYAWGQLKAKNGITVYSSAGNTPLFSVGSDGNINTVKGLPAIFPTVQGNSGDSLTNDGSGYLYWASAVAPTNVKVSKVYDTTLAYIPLSASTGAGSDIYVQNSLYVGLGFPDYGFAVLGCGSIIRANSINYTWPSTSGTIGQKLTADGFGNLYWS